MEASSKSAESLSRSSDKYHVSERKEENASDKQKKRKMESTQEEEDVASNGLPVRSSQDVVKEMIAKYLIIDELPFRHVEGKGFQNFIKLVCPTFEFPSRFTIAKDIYQLYLDQKKQLKSIMGKNRVSLTIDCWNSVHDISYMCLAAHWIDDNWKLQKRIINFIQVPSDNGDLVAEELINCLLEWGIDKVFAVTVDDASSNDVAIGRLKGHLLEKYNNIPVDGEMFRMRCSTHILNAVVTDCLKESHEAISSIRNAVRYVRSSSNRLKRFKESCKDVNIESKDLLCLDVVTRWDSTYRMLEAASKFKKGFENLERDMNYAQYFDEERLDGPPSNQDWEKVGVLVSFLRTFYILTDRFSGSLCATSNLLLLDILGLRLSLTTMDSDPGTLLGTMAVTMKQKYDKYWGKIENLNLLTFIANILDPRYKLEIVNRGLRNVCPSSEAEKMIELVKSMLTRLYAFYKQQQPTTTTQSPKLSSDDDSVMEEDTYSFLLSLGLFNDTDEDDLEYYLSDRRERLDPSFDVLHWWQQNAEKYPIVACMARDVLAVQMSAVASESAFLTGGQILDSFKSSLSPRMVESLICSKSWCTCEIDLFPKASLRQCMEEIEGLETYEDDLPGDGWYSVDGAENVDVDVASMSSMSRSASEKNY